MTKKLFSLFLISAVLGSIFFLSPNAALAALPAELPILGWAWSDNIGWVSFDSNSASSPSDIYYGVNKNVSTGVPSGYAWNDNIGWITFDQKSGCPSGVCEAKISGQTLTGWARACVVYASGCSGATKPVKGPELGGWDGWISLNTKKGLGETIQYGGLLDKVGRLTGFVWEAFANDEAPPNPLFGGLIGWISLDPFNVEPPAPLVYLEVKPTTISSGSSATLQWKTENATSCVASASPAQNVWSWTEIPAEGIWREQSTGEISNNGTSNISINYTLTCRGPGGTGSASAILTVIPTPSVTIDVEPSTIASSGGATIKWTTYNMRQSPASCKASTVSNGGSGGAWSGTGKASFNGEHTALTGVIKNNSVSYATRTYSISCIGLDGRTVSDSTQLTIIPAPSVELSVNPSTIASGGKSLITWTTANVRSCSASTVINGEGGGGIWSGDKVATNGINSESSGIATSSLKTVSSRTYHISCAGLDGSEVHAETILTVGAALSVSLRVRPAAIVSGGSAQVMWRPANAVSCDASGDWSGARTASPIAWYSTSTLPIVNNGDRNIYKIYDITCKNYAGVEAKGRAILTVIPASLVTLDVRPQTIASGEDAIILWTPKNVSSCAASTVSSGGSGGVWTGNKFSDNRTHKENLGVIENTGSINATRTYTISCDSPGGRISDTTRLTIIPAPSVRLWIDPEYPINSGDSATISWETKNVTACVGSTLPGSGAASGDWSGQKAFGNGGHSEGIGPIANTGSNDLVKNYRIDCSGPGGAAFAIAGLRIRPTDPSKLCLIPGDDKEGSSLPCACEPPMFMTDNPKACSSIHICKVPPDTREKYPQCFSGEVSASLSVLLNNTLASSSSFVAGSDGYAKGIGLRASSIIAGNAAKYTCSVSKDSGLSSFTNINNAAPNSSIDIDLGFLSPSTYQYTLNCVSSDEFALTGRATASFTVSPAPVPDFTLPSGNISIQFNTSVGRAVSTPLAVSLSPIDGFSSSVALSASKFSGFDTASDSIDIAKLSVHFCSSRTNDPSTCPTQSTVGVGDEIYLYLVSTTPFRGRAEGDTTPNEITITGTGGSLTRTATITVNAATGEPEFEEF